MMKFKAVIEIDEDQLRACKKENAFDDEERKEIDTRSVSDMATGEFGWLQDSGIFLESLTPIKEK